MHVRRSNLLMDSMEAVESIRKDDMRKIFRFEFQHEPGVDAGGVQPLPIPLGRANFVILEVRDFACICGSKYAPSM